MEHGIVEVAPAEVRGLEDLEAPPERVWARGSLPAPPLVAIVGTRRADRAALDFTRRIAEQLAAGGVGVVSGGAEGIDAAAHRGALDGGGRTWVVQAAPLEAPYPGKHRRLFDAVLDAGGGWLSETPPGEVPYPSRFLSRNRIVAAVADAVVVVQAPVRSGALSTARHAQKLGRPLLVVPHAPWDPRGDGCVSMLRDGARPCTRAEDVAKVIGVALRAAPAPVPEKPELPPELERVWSALSTKGRHPDDVAAETGLAAPRVQVALIQLAARGLAHKGGDGWVVRG